jgi:hypothetical protein
MFSNAIMQTFSSGISETENTLDFNLIIFFYIQVV